MAPLIRRRRPAAKKRVMKKRAPRVPRPVGTGAAALTRRVQSLYLTNSSSFGVPAVTNPSPTPVFTLGTATAHPVFGNNFTVPFTMQFSLDQLAQYTDMTNFCDRFKITNVIAKFQFNSDSITGYSTATQNQPNIVPSVVWIQDYDDANTLTAVEINAKMGVKRRALNNGSFHAISVKPKIAAAAYNGLSTGYTVPKGETWVNTAYPSVPHYGIKGYIENMYLGGITGGAACVTIDLTYTVQLKDFQ